MSTEDRKTQLGVSVDTTEVEQGFAKISARGRNMAQQVSQAGQQAAHGIDAIGTSAEGPAAKVDRATSRIVASIQRATAAAQSAGKTGSAFYESLASQRGANLDVLKPYLAQLDAVTQKQMDAKIAMAQGTASLNSIGMSAQATAAAMRNVPAQFTDIFTSLQAGQAPMTVLLQQGGQLKDMFGGIGNASKALGSYVFGLINPFTLLAAGVGAVGYAYYKGSQESDAYNKALILSGNIAGTTSGQLGAMAVSISKVTGTQSAAAAALAEMAQASGVGRDNLESFTRAAIKFESTTGTAVSETVKQFKELAKSPLDASLKLNDTYNYLTASVYRQIKALEEQGKATESAELAQKTFANTLDTRSAQMVQNLGYVEQGWKAIKDAVMGAGDAMLNVGRPQTMAVQLASVQAALEEQGKATESAERAKQTAAIADWDKTGAKYLSDKVKMEQDINAAKILGKSAGESQVKIEERVKAIRESYAKKGGAKSKEGDPFAADREYAKDYAKAWEDFTKIADDAAGRTDDLSKAQARLVEYLKSPAYTAHSAAMRETVLQSAYAAINSEKLAAEKKAEAAAMKESADAAYANSEAIYKSMVATEDKLRAQLQENQTMGMTAVQIAQLVKARDLEAAAALDAKAAQYQLSGERLADIDNIKAQADALRQLADARLDNAVKKQEQSYWQSFFGSIDQTAHQVWTNVLQGGQDMWSKLRNTAKSVFFDWLYQMTLKKWIFSVGVGVSGNAAMAQSAAGSLGSAGGAGGLGNLAGSLSNYLGPQAMSGLSAAAGAAGFVYAASAAASGKWGDAIGTGIGTAIGGPVGAVIGHVLGSSLDKLTGNTGTKPSIEGGYASAGTQGSANGKNYVDGLYGGQLDLAAKSVVDGVSQTYAKVVQSLGGKAGMLTGQAFLGYDGNGGSKGSQNALSLDAQLNGNWLYNRWTEQGGNLNAGTTSDEMTAAVNVASKQILLKALAATDLGPALNAYLATVITQGKTLTELDATLADVTGFAAFRDAVKSLPFDYLVSASVEAEKALLAAAGGFDSFRDSLGTYIELFYSDAEKAAIKTKSLTAAFASIGVDLPSLNAGTRDWYKALVDSLGAQDLSVEANARAYATALSLASAVNDLAPAMQAAADATAAATDAASQAATQARADAISAAQNALTKSVASERTRLSDMASNRSALVASMQSVVDLLATSATELYAQASGTAMQSAAQGRAAITAALAMAKAGGIVPEQASLSAAIAAARAGLDGAQYSTQFEADRQRLILAGELSQLQAATGTQLSIAEQQLQATQDQLSALDESVRYAQDLVDAANGIDTSVKTVAAALADLVAVLAPAKANTATTAGITSSAGTAAVFGGTSSSAAGESAYTYNPADFGGLSADEYRRSVKGILAALGSVPSYDIGTPFVPTDMLARVHQGEAIIPRAYNPFLAAPGAAGQSNAELAASLRDMATQLAEIKANTASTADATSRGTKVWEGAAQGNLAIATTAS